MPTNVSDVASSLARTMISAPVEPRIEVMLVIFFASLFAASFPTASKQLPVLRIPAVVFFIGKHFGTGVILATAFIHLLDDAFRSLQNPLVKIRYGNVGKWTGLIILGSLLVIFLIEYMSTCYVDYLQAKPSAPSTPIGSVHPSRSASLKPLSRPISYNSISTNAEPTLNTGSAFLTESTPLLPSAQPTTETLPRQPRREVSTPNLGPIHSSLPSRGNSPHLYHHRHVHHIYTPSVPSTAVSGVPIDLLTNSPRIFRQLGLGHSHPHSHEQEDEGQVPDHIDYHYDHDHEHHLRIGRRRQVVGLLVLQLGIMIHSLVIGLTLAVADGGDFTSLTTAILFHQLFEGLSLGIRIASLPPKHIDSHTIVEDAESAFSTPTTRNPDSDPAAPSDSASHPPHTHIVDNSNPQAIGGVPPRNTYLQTSREREIHWLKPIMWFLFAVTTPFGMGAGMILLKKRNGNDTTQMLLIKGTMSAISAGMLIYVGTVEMIAGDFVFGDVDGGHGHGHGHGHVHHPHPHPHQGSGGSHFNDHGDGHPHTPGQTSNCDDGKHHPDEQPSKPTVTKKILAVLSLLAGAAGMALIGLGE
ncbi:Zinc/iron permease [Phlegmacium glaucopus]|nr:Zinc/iron permease [Phlegmacium glaucopus]